jgi:DNA-binding transcriptional ArsR family regulator
VRAAAARTDAFRAIADPTRRAVLDLLRQSERSVSELCEPFAMSQPALSQHLKVLRRAGLVTTRRAGRLRVYALDPRPLRAVSEWVAHYERFWDEKLDALGRYLDETAPKRKR